jgi:hypothetical protein
MEVTAEVSHTPVGLTGRASSVAVFAAFLLRSLGAYF